MLPDGIHHKRGVVKDLDAVQAAYRHVTENNGVALPNQIIEESLPVAKEKTPSTAKDIVQVSQNLGGWWQ